MNSTKGRNQRGADKHANKSSIETEDIDDSLEILPSDTILAEKDEVKRAEELLRQKKQS